jgi:dolichol-phosphate mannosyltransferase
MEDTETIYCSIIIPVFNNELELPELLRRIKDTARSFHFSYEIILIDDGSSDGSLDFIKKEALASDNIIVISFEHNSGQNLAVKAGLDYAHGEIAVILDADLQDPPEYIPLLLEKLKDNTDAVFARRKGNFQSFSRSFTSKIFKTWLSIATGGKIPSDTGLFVAINKNILKMLRENRETEPYLVGLIAMLSKNIETMEIIRQPRIKSPSGYSFYKRLRLAFKAFISLTFSSFFRESKYPKYVIKEIYEK